MSITVIYHGMSLTVLYIHKYVSYLFLYKPLANRLPLQACQEEGKSDLAVIKLQSMIFV